MDSFAGDGEEEAESQETWLDFRALGLGLMSVSAPTTSPHCENSSSSPGKPRAAALPRRRWDSTAAKTGKGLSSSRSTSAPSLPGMGGGGAASFYTLPSNRAFVPQHLPHPVAEEDVGGASSAGLVGRSAALLALQGVFAEAVGAALAPPRFALVQGGEGVGKTALLRAFASYARSHAAARAAGVARRKGDATPVQVLWLRTPDLDSPGMPRKRW